MEGDIVKLGMPAIFQNHTRKASQGFKVRATFAAACLHRRRKPTTSTHPGKREANLDMPKKGCTSEA